MGKSNRLKVDEKDIICRICTLGIDLQKEFVEVIHFKKKEEIASIGFYHTNCFRDKLGGGSGLKALQEKANRILDSVQAKVG